jgi:hypothetical protein
MKSITELAKSVGYPMLVFMGTPYVSPELRRLVEAAVEQEREACAKLCDAFQARDVGMQPAECAGAIRARSQA